MKPKYPRKHGLRQAMRFNRALQRKCRSHMIREGRECIRTGDISVAKKCRDYMLGKSYVVYYPSRNILDYHPSTPSNFYGLREIIVLWHDCTNYHILAHSKGIFNKNATKRMYF